MTAKETIAALIAATTDPSELLDLRDELRLGAETCNDKYRDTPHLWKQTCYLCGSEFSIMVTPREDRCPETCVECYEKEGKHSCLRDDPKYQYTKLRSGCR